MQVTVHSVESATVTDFTDNSKRSTDSPPFVGITVVDGKSSTINFLLSSSTDAYRLLEAAREAMDLLGIVETATA